MADEAGWLETPAHERSGQIKSNYDAYLPYL